MNTTTKEVGVLTELIKLADEMDRAGNNDGANKIDAVINSFSKNNLKNKELIDSVLSLADELDAEGMHAFADKVQDFLTKLAEDDEEDDASDEEDNMDMSLRDLVKKMDENGLGSATMKIEGWSVSLYKKEDKEDCGCDH